MTDYKLLSDKLKEQREGFPSFFAPNGIELPNKLKYLYNLITQRPSFENGEYFIGVGEKSLNIIGAWDAPIINECKLREYLQGNGYILPIGTAISSYFWKSIPKGHSSMESSG